MHCLIWCTLLVVLCLGHALVDFPKFYSDPMQLMIGRPSRAINYRSERLKGFGSEQKWKRRRATPIQISPFFYLSNPNEDSMVYVPPQSSSTTE
ncbi:unnamed protein product [Bursaphelenchus xylophilus]|uniref:(pine wood nematode) hypothetical protein n=1 Tax=Bursaphelenchus xylophilus TaxID=6326 RepID=A0A1I7RLH4_BURXY|nr:unnamed protein product [Bursaphelenchus xylophilus]CAG9082983.1 unnamed protein product [Bursaphelenchus xylophilus]